VTPAFRLDSNFSREACAVTLTLRNRGTKAVSGFRLALTSLFRVKDGGLRGARVVEQISNYLVVAPPDGFVVTPGGSWSFTAERLSHRLTHYTYGPKSAYLICADESLEPVAVSLMTRDGAPGEPRLSAGAIPAANAADAALPVTPFPAEASVGGARSPAGALSLVSDSPDAAAAYDAVARLAGRLFRAEPVLFDNRGGLAVTAARDRLPEGVYRIAFAEDRIVLSASGRPGFQHGFVTLAQMLRAARRAPKRFAFPSEGMIADAPRFGWRGFHLDVARQTYECGELLRVLDRMAWIKLNRFHLHLTDDEGWRFDVPGYPQLAAIAAWRGHGLPVPPLLGSPPERSGLVYSRADFRMLVAHAEALCIDVVPEVDIPGHCYAALQAIPSLRDPDEKVDSYRGIQGFPDNALNPALPATYAFLEAVLAELAALFPGRWIHIGGDEVAEDAWLGSPAARALMRKQGWTTTHELQSHFLNRVQEMLRQIGRGTGAWQEAALGGGVDQQDGYLVAWRDAASGRALAARGYDVVMAPAQACYLDMAQSDAWWDAGASWAGTVPLETSYRWEAAEGWTGQERARLLGVQACLWSENLHERRLLDYLAFPRLAAIAETGWTPAARKDFRRFSASHSLLF
jgi:hexosaminidase